jgi:hypothetical protein
MFICTLLNLFYKQKLLNRVFYFFAILLLEYNNKTDTLVSIKLLCKYKRSFQIPNNIFSLYFHILLLCFYYFIINNISIYFTYIFKNYFNYKIKN